MQTRGVYTWLNVSCLLLLTVDSASRAIDALAVWDSGLNMQIHPAQPGLKRYHFENTLHRGRMCVPYIRIANVRRHGR
jgi:hypothetical protein